MSINPAFRTASPQFIDPAFKTHLNYVTFLAQESQGLTLTVNTSIRTSATEDREFSKKIKIVKFTLDNLTEEMKMINGLQEYAIVCSSWVSVKGYYLLFNLILILDYLLTYQASTLTRTPHSKAQKIFRSHLKQSQISFSNNIFNEVHTCIDINTWKFPSGQNLSNLPSADRYKQIVRKLCEYCKDEYKRQNNISRLQGASKIEFEGKTEINLIEFFYWYRIKANYRDLEYLDVNVNTSDFYDYYKNYFDLIMNVFISFKRELNRLSRIRFNRDIF